MRKHSVQIFITAASLLALCAHIAWPELKIDGTTVALIVVAVLPWLTPLLRSLELPGGLKLEFREQLKSTSNRARAAGLIAPPEEVDNLPTYPFERVVKEDPKLALAGLRIELEILLSRWASMNGIEAEQASVGRLLRLLGDRDLLTREERSILSDMVGLLNLAVHGRDVDFRSAEWALREGKAILASISQRLE